MQSSLENPVLVKLRAKTLVEFFFFYFKIRKKKNSILLIWINKPSRLDLLRSDPWTVIHLHFLSLPSSFPDLQISDLPSVATELPAPCPWHILGHVFFYQNNLPTCLPPHVTFSISIHSRKLTWKVFSSSQSSLAPKTKPVTFASYNTCFSSYLTFSTIMSKEHIG